jgi:hypothetical protein
VILGIRFGGLCSKQITLIHGPFGVSPALLPSPLVQLKLI